MTPTPKLRWIEREHEVGLTGNMVHVETVLQQWWNDDSWKHVNHFDANGKHISTGKWIDIPLEKEE